LRLSPQSRGMKRIVELFASAIADEPDTGDRQSQLHKLALGELSNGFWHDEAGMCWQNKTME